MKAYGKDPDIKDEKNSTKNINYLWSCLNLNTNKIYTLDSPRS